MVHLQHRSRRRVVAFTRPVDVCRRAAFQRFSVRSKKIRHPKVPDSLNSNENLAEWTGLEPATPGVTGRYSNQLNYHSVMLLHPCRCHAPRRAPRDYASASHVASWWVLTGSNRRHSPCKGDALPAELSTLGKRAASARRAILSSQPEQPVSLPHPSTPCQRGTWAPSQRGS